MAANTPQYYRPFLPSDSELSDSDAESAGSSIFWDKPETPPRPPNALPEIEGPDYAAFARTLNQPLVPKDQREGAEKTTGPTFGTYKQEDTFGLNQIENHKSYSRYDPKDVSGQKIKMTIKDVNTVVMLQSRDRDRSVFNQPTNCQLFLPRVYKNIQSFSVTQVNLTSAFFYFRVDKENLEIQIYEKGRVVYSSTLNPGRSSSAIPLQISSYIRPGSYNINQLLTEIQTQLNRTPVFYDFLNGFTDFYTLFVVNGDYALNFNYPGDTFYDAVRRRFVDNPTRAQIAGFYFQSQYANQLSYTIDQVRVAYYYPVLKEAVLDPITNFTDYNLDAIDPTTGLPFASTDDAVQYIVYSFAGLSDTTILQLVNQNVTQLDLYRLQHTFRYSLVNRYLCSYDQTNYRVTIQTSQLNTSLTNLLNTQYNVYFAQLLLANGITADQYKVLLAQSTNLLSILQSMYDYLQTKLARYFAINYGSYSRTYFINTNNSLLVRDGLDASGVAFTYNFTNGTNTEPRSTDFIEDFRTNPPYYWNLMSNLGIQSTIGPPINMGSASNSFEQGSSNYPYNILQSNIEIADSNRHFIDLSGNVYTDFRRRAGDILININNAKYTIFKFRSKYRQTLQVETIGRQLDWRYTTYNSVNDVPYPISTLFDYNYTWLVEQEYQNKINYPISFNTLYGWQPVNNTQEAYERFGLDYTSSLGFWGSNWDFVNTASIKGRFYTMQSPQNSNAITNFGGTRFDMNMTLLASNTAGAESDLALFMYHDIGVFNADISGARQENPFHYKYSTILKAGQVSTTFTFTTYELQNYYFIVRPVSENPNLVNYRIVPWFSNNTSTIVLNDTGFFDNLQDPTTSSALLYYDIAHTNDPAWIQLPIQSNLWIDSSPSNDFINNQVQSQPPIIGYDTAGVSSDLTDYMPFASNVTGSNVFPPATLRADPTNNYFFQFNSPYNIDQQSYFYNNSLNALYTSNLAALYTWKGASYRQYKQVQWYSPTYLQDPSQILSYSANDISPYITPYTISTTSTAITGYTYDGNNTDSKLILGLGVAGYTFLPSDGTWEVQRLTFKTNFLTQDPVLTTNMSIHFLGVFITSEVLADPIYFIKPQNALAICLREKVNTYTSSNLNLGFDSGLGSYYTFSNISSLVVRSNVTMSGYSQVSKSFIPDSNSYYSIIPFTIPGLAASTLSNAYSSNATIKQEAIHWISTNMSAANVTTIQNLAGSAIPYPYANKAFVSSVFYDNQSAPNGKAMVLSSSNGNSSIYGPTNGNDESVVQYEQSVPYVNSHVHYLTQQNIITDASGFSLWSNAPAAPSEIYPSVLGYMMFQTGNFYITPYKYYTSVVGQVPPLRSFSNTQQTTLTIDQIFPASENTNLVAVSGNNQYYCFLGTSNNMYLRFKLYNPVTGEMTELPQNPLYQLDTTFHLVENFVFHNDNKFFLTAKDTSTNTLSLIGDVQYQSTATFSVNYELPGYENSILQMDPSGGLLYLGKQTTLNAGITTMNIYNFNSNDSTGYIGTNSNGYTINLQTGGLLPTEYNHFAVTLNSGIEELYLLNNTAASFSNTFFRIRTYQAVDSQTSNALISKAEQVFKDSSDNLIIPQEVFGGAGGSKWLLFETTPTIMGNRNDAYDAPRSLDIAWQIFFPAMKVEMRKLTNSSSPIVDLTNITYPEWPHTMMFGYSNYTSLSNDIYANGGQWGMESKQNFYVSDVQFGGYWFNSYVMNFPLYPNFNCNANDPDQYNYLAIRGYSPTESFQTMLRFYLPNRYDFGFVKLRDISNEAIFALSNRSIFNPSYYNALTGFNSNFTFSNQNFGSNTLQGYTGSNLNSSNFGDFLRQYSSIYSQYISTSKVVNTIQSTLQGNINSFIAHDLQYILPASALTRQRYTDPLLFQIQWKSQLSPNFLQVEDEWGLGWNLGYDKRDTDFSTVHTGTSFFKIQQDFIYLRLNPEFNINRLDAGGKENYKQGRESTGITSQYYCKLLLTNFGGNATTFIHNPVTFNPPLGRLTKLQFQWLYPNGVVIDNNDAEWNVSVNIVERMEIPEVPDKMIFTPADPRTGLPAQLPKDFAEPKLQAEGDAIVRRDAKMRVDEQKALIVAAGKRYIGPGTPMANQSKEVSVTTTIRPMEEEGYETEFEE